MDNGDNGENGSRDGIVVCGVDGSPGARTALAEAIRAAARRHDEVLAVTAYEPIENLGAWGYGPAAGIPLPDVRELHAAAESAARAMVEEVSTAMKAELDPVPTVRVEARSGRPAAVLVDAARGADALVVGHRGRGAVASTLLGSTGLGCVLHAPCPVTVVPEPRRGEPADTGV